MYHTLLEGNRNNIHFIAYIQGAFGVSHRSSVSMDHFRELALLRFRTKNPDLLNPDAAGLTVAVTSSQPPVG